MPDGLKKRYTLSEAVITHIFEGEISDGGLAGFHSEAVKTVENGKVEVVGGWPAGQLARRGAGKSYWANVKVKIGDKWYGPKMCSFFPKPGAGVNFDKPTLIRMIEQALTSPTDTSRSSRDEWNSQPRALRKNDVGGQLESIRVGGVRCKVQHQGGAGIATIYPLVPE